MTQLMRLFSATDQRLWRLALPMILSNITVPLLGLVDTAVIGHLNSPIYLGGVAIGTTITSFIFMLLLFLRMSTTGLTAQAFGAGDRAALARALMQPLMLAIVAGGLFILCREPITQLATHLIGGDEAVLEQARIFIHIRWLSAPATLANLVILGWLLGVQYARAPVILLVVGNLVNLLLDLWLVVGLGWQVAGAATATAVAEYVTFALGIALVWRALRQNQIPAALLWQGWWQDVSRLLRLNRDIMLRSLLLQICFASLTLIGARMGAEIVAVNAVLLMFLTFTAYALDGFAYAVEAVSGQAFGAKDSQQLLLVWQAACRQAGIVAAAFAIIYWLLGDAIIAHLTTLPGLRELAHHFLGWQAIIPLVGVWCYLLDGVFVGATRGREMRNSMALAALGFMLAVLLTPWLGNHALWLAITVFLGLRGLTLWIIWRRLWQQQRWFVH